ncbi:hypothetical protein J6590_050789 [Homalodisca vitripennis]|nr:hypothetical protein J6590_050789 [Homalodisca vitripennis]
MSNVRAPVPLSQSADARRTVPVSVYSVAVVDALASDNSGPHLLCSLPVLELATLIQSIASQCEYRWLDAIARCGDARVVLASQLSTKVTSE